MASPNTILPVCLDALHSRLTREELAILWRVSARTIERREALGIGPRPMKIGGRVLYRREDVLAWEESLLAAGGGGHD